VGTPDRYRRDVLIDFQVAHSTEDGDSGPLAIEPVVDGVAFSELVAEFERSNSMEPAGGYTGIVPKNFSFGLLERYFMGDPESEYWRRLGCIALLGCTCGEHHLKISEVITSR
jgi:hypothetical protein